MAQKNTKDGLQRVHKVLKDEFNEVKLKRMSNGIDKVDKPIGFKRFTLALTRHRFFSRIKEDIINADLREKRGQLAPLLKSGGMLIAVAVIALIVVLMSAVWILGFETLTAAITDLPFDSPELNVSEKAEITFGNLNTSFQQLRWISFVIIFAMFMGVLIANIALRDMQIHPAFFMGYWIISTAVVAFSIFISRTYQALLETPGAFGATLGSFTGASFWVINLPFIISVIALLGGVPLFINLFRESQQGGLV